MKDTWRNHYILDDQGNVQIEPDLFTWGDWMQNNRDKRLIAWDEVNGFIVSTIFLGLDFDIAEECENAVLFETLIRDGDNLDNWRWARRYDSLESAKAGHAIATELARVGSFNEGQC